MLRQIETATDTALQLIGSSKKRSKVRALLRKIPAGKRILWVDDKHPKPADLKIKTLELLGVFVVKARSNAEAKALFLSGNHFDLIISDIARGYGRGDEGIALPSILKGIANVVPPFIFYVANVQRRRYLDYPVISDPYNLIKRISKCLSPPSFIAWLSGRNKGRQQHNNFGTATSGSLVDF